MRSTDEMKAEAILTTQTNLIEELDAGTFTTTIEIGEAMLKIKLECGNLLLARARETRKGNHPPVTDLNRLVSGHLKTSPHLKTRSRTFGPARVGQLTDGATLVRFQRTAGETILPSNEAQIRPLTRVGGVADAERAAMWQEAKELAGGGWPTPKQVQAVADRQYPREPKVKKVPTFDEWITVGVELGYAKRSFKDFKDEGLVPIFIARPPKDEPESNAARPTRLKLAESLAVLRSAPDGVVVMVSSKDVVMPDGTPLEEQLRKDRVRPTKAWCKAKGFKVPIEQSPNAIHIGS